MMRSEEYKPSALLVAATFVGLIIASLVLARLSNPLTTSDYVFAVLLALAVTAGCVMGLRIKARRATRSK